MIYYFTIFLSGLVFAFGLLKLQHPFFLLAQHTLSLLNSLLDADLDETAKHRLVSQKLIQELKALLLFSAGFALVVVLSYLPLFIYEYLFNEIIPPNDALFWVAFSLGGLLPFLVASFKTKKEAEDYSEWSKLLHRIVLDNYNVSQSLFTFNRFFARKKLNQGSAPPFVIVSGLARAGTTAFTQQLYKTEKFYSLTYEHVPFLLAPDLKKVLRWNRKEDLRERSHQDGVLVGVQSVEALEEYFFKCFLKDSFIRSKSMVEHTIDDRIYKKYITYQQLIAPKTETASIYLAKNNNFLLRLRAMRSLNQHFYFLCLFRHPMNHAASLLAQHQRFSELQTKEPFVLEYMNWLGHHEFGLNHKPFQFDGEQLLVEEDRMTIDYWLKIWINYYRKVIEMDKSTQFYLIDYQDFLHHPNMTIQKVASLLDLPLSPLNIVPFKHTKQYENEAKQSILAEALTIYHQLKNLKINISSPVLK